VSDTRQGQTWPLNVLFVATLIGCAIGIIISATKDHRLDTLTIALLALLMVITGVLLYVPCLYLMTKVPTIDALGEQIRRTEQAVHAVQPRLNQIQNSLTDLTARLNTMTTTLNGLAPLQTGVTGLAAQLNGLAPLQTGVTALTTQLNPGGINSVETALKALTDIQKSLTTIAGQLTAMDAKIKQPGN